MMKRRLLQLLQLGLIALLVLLMAGCAVGGGGSDDDDDDDFPQDERNFSIGATSDRNGEAAVTFQVPADSSKLAVTAIAGSGDVIRFAQFSSSNGVNYLNPGGIELSFADSFAPELNALMAPSRRVDPELVSGQTYTAVAQLGSSGSGTAVTFLVNSRADGSFSGGRLRVNLFFVGDVGADSGTRQVMAIALDEFRRIYGGAGIELDVVEFEIDGPTVIPQPFEGDSFYEQNSALSDSLGVNLFIAGDIEGSSGEILGIAGGIPGPPNPSSRSGVAVGIFPGAGPDGTYSNTEVRILGETLAHESGHFLGLFHPVDFSGDRAAETDPLDDTETCRMFAGCLANDSLTSNLMFVSPVADGSGGFVRQDQLSPDQAGVLNRNISVD